MDPVEIRETRNHNWTRPELNKVYTMRVVRNKPVSAIIEKLKIDVRKTQVYNMIRLLRNNRKNKCFQCSSLLTKQELELQKSWHFKRCGNCKKANEKRKQRIKKKNLERKLCVICGKNPIRRRNTGVRSVDHSDICTHCLSYTYRRHVLNGVCGVCGRNPIDRKRSIGLCGSCLDRNAGYARKIRRELKMLVRLANRRKHNREMDKNAKNRRLEKA